MTKFPTRPSPRYTDLPLSPQRDCLQLQHPRLTPRLHHLRQSFHIRGRDREAHSIAAILHNFGWDLEADFASKDKRMEVDGAIATRDSLWRGGRDAWDKHLI